MKTEMCKIVLHDGYDKALAALKEKHHCIIAGNPGIGKTTLAKILLCHYAQEGFEPLVVNNDIGDAWALISKGQDRKMAILYDDFLGQTRYDQLKFGKNEDSLLVQLIRFTERSHNIRFILTSREYIIADARISHGVFDAYVDLIKKCTINLSDYSFTHRAKVLFNHLYFSNLPRDKVKAIVDSKLYVKIIQHRHFNPRIVSAIANKANSDSLSPEAFLEYIDTRFDNPAEIWARPFQNEIMPLSRWVLAALWTLGGAARLEVLKEAVLELSSCAYEAELALEFGNSLREVAENFISSEAYPCSKDSSKMITVVSFQNPSISDYIESFLRSEIAWIETLASKTIFFEQHLQLISLLESSVFDKKSDIAGVQLVRLNDGFDKPKGAIYRSFEGPLVFTDRDIFSANERGLALLKLASFLSPEHPDHKRARKIITTEEGWSKQFNNLAKMGSVPYATIRLIKWVVGSVYWNGHEKLIKRSFYRALFACINSQPDWCEELSTLNVLHECLSILGISLTTLEKLKFQTDANRAANKILKNEDDIQRLEEAADNLEKFQERMRFGNRQVVLDLRIKAESQSLSRQEDPSEMDEVALSLDEESFDLDLLFSELLY
ncbi:hypothetical protein [Stutzerimonas kunmingensis]|uniref:nSTAND3 domain-containing NTPase n=1 Tax=Stutzerimonas kunmingensis TaxID=1211807 RepID=UPI002104601F|nr:hypothetical protein [Stutzerimonas kunmingensis]MCQ2036179.1 hypothetical protein [Stutzerimonas kunmingensis]